MREARTGVIVSDTTKQKLRELNLGGNSPKAKKVLCVETNITYRSVSEAIQRINTEADVIWVDGHSDYGHAFEVFWEKWGKEINPKSSVILLGDARNNYHASQAWVIKEMKQKARKVYWLNPEPRSYWNTGDSIVGEYGVHTDGVFECRNLRQLEAFVEKLA